MGSRTRAPATPSAAPASKRFVVERCLGEGSMGAVFRAFDRERNVHVALKTLRRADASGIYRFKREFRALADVSHPGLVQLHELISEGNEWFFTMELVEGRDFLDYVLGGPRRTQELSPNPTRELRAPIARAQGLEVLFPSPLKHPDKLRAVLQQVVRALMAVHAAGKLHRDLKPDNVMITAEGRAIVLDFGIAAELESERRDPLETGVMGTPAYMSPEQAAGLPAGAATDWYALGVMLYEALTGRVPFDGPYREVLRTKQNEDPPAPSLLVSDVPPGLDALCMRLLARDPSTRPSGPEILEALGAAAETTPQGLHAADAGPPFLGRERELGELERALAGTDAGVPAVVLVHGATGVGKTALLERFLDRVAEKGAVTLAGRCYEHESVPFKALDSLVDALSRYLGRLTPAEAAELLPKDVPALVQMFPVLERVDALRTARRRLRGSSDQHVRRHQATLALEELLERIAVRQPLVVAIDDLQWGDVDSARLLAELVSGIESPALLLLCGYRSTDKERSPCVATLHALLKERSRSPARELHLRELPEREALALASHVLGGDAGSAAAVARESRGNPYLLIQLADHVRSDRSSAPEHQSGVRVSIERALSERLDALSSDAGVVLHLAAVSGRPVSEHILAMLVPDTLPLAAALTELRRTKLVRGVGSADARAISLYHDSLREPILMRIGEEAQRAWHKRLAVAIEASEPVDLEALIDHLLGAGEHERASIFAIGAAHAAMAALAFDQAAQLFEIAVRYHHDVGWRQELLIQWAEALRNAGRSTRAAEVYLQAAKRASAEEAVALQVKAGTQLLVSGQWTRGMEVLGPPLEKLGIPLARSSDDSWRLALKLAPALKDGDFSFTPVARDQVPAERRVRLDSLWSLVQATFSGDPLICQTFILQHLSAALESGEVSHVVLGLCAYFISIDLALSDLSRTKPKSLQRAEELAQKLDDPHCRAWVAYARCFSYQNQGLLKPAALAAAEAEELLRTRCRDVAAELSACRMMYAFVQWMMEQLEELAPCEAWIREALEHEDLLSATRLRLTMIPRVLAEGDVERATRMLVVPEDLPGHGQGLSTLLMFNASVNTALYGDAQEPIEKALALLPQLERSPLLTLRIWRSDHMLLRARLLLGASLHLPDAAACLADAEKALGSVDAAGIECHADHARVLRAALTHRRGDDAQALALLDSVLLDADMFGESRHLLSCARMQKGALLGGEHGRELVQEAERALVRRGVKEPARFVRLFAPGFAPGRAPCVPQAPDAAPSVPGDVAQGPA